MALFTEQPARIIVAGGGYAGFHAAAGLARRLDPDRTRLTVVQPGLRFTDVCRLHEAALRPVNIAYRLPDVLHGLPIQWIDAQVQEVDTGQRILTVDAYGHPADLPFDTLILSAGSASNDYGIPGVLEHAVTLKSLDDADRARELVRRIRRLDARGSLVIAGAGLTGVELAAEIADEWNKLPRRERPGITLVDAASRLLPASGPEEAAYARGFLLERDVRLKLGAPIAQVEENAVVIKGGNRLPADGIIWCGGVRVPKLPGLEALYTGPGGRIAVTAFLETPVNGIYAIGDQASVQDRRGKTVPPRAMYACQMGDQVAAIIAARISGKEARPFRAMDQGELTSLGRFDGVGYVKAGPRRIIVKGAPAAAMKFASLQAHLVKLMSETRMPILPEGSLAAALVERLRNR